MSEYKFIPIQNRERARQLIDFEGMELGERVWPTDFDAVIEWHDEAWTVFEAKYLEKHMPTGQRLALERYVKDTHKAGKLAIAAVVEHDVADPEQDVRLAECIVREIYVGGEFRWRPPSRDITARTLLFEWIAYAEKRTHGKEGD